MVSYCYLYAPAKISSPPFKSSSSSRRKISSSQSVVKLKHPRLELVKNRLIRLADAGNLDYALSTLDLMTQQRIPADLVTYSVLLKSCIRSRDLNRGKIIHARLIESGLELDTIVLNSLISLYSKCGDWGTAKAIFDGMGSGGRDLISWSAMISCFSHNNQELQAIATFYEMLKSGHYPNQFCFAGVIQACSNAENVRTGLVIFGFVTKTGYLESDLCVGCALIDMFAKGSGDMVSARKVFDRMPERNVVTWTLMITRYAHSGCTVDAVGLFLDMELSGFVPDRFTLTSVTSACAELGSFQLGQQLHSRAIKSGLAFDVCVGCSLVDMYAKCVSDGSMDCSRKIFDRMPDHNVMSWTAIITGYMQLGGFDEEAIGLFCEMIQEGVPPNHFTFSSVLKACGNLSDPFIGEQVYAHAVKLGLASVNCVGNAVISMYARSGRMEEARKAFDILFEKNMVSYNTILDGYAKNMNSKEAFELFHQSEIMEIGVSAFTFASLLSGAASIGSINKGEQLHARLLKAGFESNQCIGNALISMYSRCGNIEAASKVFNEMDDQNVISWSSMITGFAKHGYAREALKTFHEMVETGTKPNEITFIAVLSACSHVGMIPEGWKYFTSMHTEHGIIPRMEHYACMVDLLGRSGFFREALEFIYSMPFKADALVWRTLLGACQVHGNMDIGKQAAQHILELEPQDPAAYILLSNLYASIGQWDNVVEIRKSMKERKMIKEAGCSWIEIGNTVHKFHVGDTSHSRAREIYAELDCVASKIKSMGYIPDTDFVLHDVKEEQKEQYLFQHSEKIAVAFGLISTSKSRPIRIFKNLRVCGDCHTAMKFISEATGREIVVRDSNRFHHIKDGFCSCNDYW
ncbi:pentatricopeptide repeat-containing protein At3g49170, chloroplastic [Macadamia integrifolia]|uniref:pentatricopeptide repeat-containing protein At3g49170, chloroplastic n=1 Tax=Macadamia integrifolia TaxID=60698 RepID=UPI001C4E72A4|nr:pentatricopeptide repeat-containing protein At3g49170, chloroplastic [Macadamia integrifolia]